MELEAESSFICDACNTLCLGVPAATGLLLFPRGDAHLREEPPICEACVVALGMTAMLKQRGEEEG